MTPEDYQEQYYIILDLHNQWEYVYFGCSSDRPVPYTKLLYQAFKDWERSESL